MREPALRAERSFVSLQSALAFIGRADRLSLGYVTSITAEANYYLRARSRLINGELPLPLRVQSYFTKDWRPVSDWRIIEVVKEERNKLLNQENKNHHKKIGSIIDKILEKLPNEN